MNSWYARAVAWAFPAHLERLNRREFFFELLWIFGIAVGALGLQRLGVLGRLESLGIDAFISLSAPRQSDDIAIVQITDDDFHNPALFNGQRPLNPNVVQKLVDAVALANPRVIAIDLDVDAKDFRQPARIPVVWARDIKPAEADRDRSDEALEPAPLADGETGQISGLSIFPEDADGVVRRYRRQFPITGPVADALHQTHMDSFPWAVLKQYCPATRHKSTSVDSELILNYVGDRYSFDLVDAGALLKLASGPNWSSTPLITDRIVLIGGVFFEAHEEYRTPVGPMAGVQLVAHAIQADLSGRGVHEQAILVTVAVDLIAGVLLVYLNWRFRGVGGFLIAIAFIFVLCVLASYLAFAGLAYWIDFPLVMFGILLHLQIHNFRERGKHAAQHGLAHSA